MTYSETFDDQPMRQRFGLMHLALFSVVILMLATALPAPLFGYGNCVGTVAALEGPLLPVAA
ncbi:MAG: hypothetical protein AAF230_02110 [Pseudomonadota bacterium]